MSNGHGGAIGRVNRYPRGFLSLVDSAAEGQTPHLLPQVVQPVIEMAELYEQTMRDTRIGLTGATMGTVSTFSPSTGSDVRVPDGEFWHVHAIGFSLAGGAVLAAGTTYVWQGGVRYAGQTGSLIVLTGAPITTGPGVMGYQGWQGSLWLQPGDYPVIFVNSVTLGTAVNGHWNLLISRYRL